MSTKWEETTKEIRRADGDESAIAIAQLEGVADAQKGFGGSSTTAKVCSNAIARIRDLEAEVSQLRRFRHANEHARTLEQRLRAEALQAKLAAIVDAYEAYRGRGSLPAPTEYRNVTRTILDAKNFLRGESEDSGDE